MIAAVHQGDLHVNHGIAAQWTVIQGLHHALFDGRDIFPGNGASRDCVLENQARPLLQRLYFLPDVAKLSVVAALPAATTLDAHRLGDGFPVRNPWAAHAGFHPKLALQAVNQHLQV